MRTARAAGFVSATPLRAPQAGVLQSSAACPCTRPGRQAFLQSTRATATAPPPAENEHRLTAGVRARTVVHVGRSATLCTASTKHEGVPFGSHVDYILDERGCPVFLLAAAAAHTKNIAEEKKVSLYCQPPASAGQAGCRVTLVGAVEKMCAEDVDDIREEYIDSHAHAAEALEYPDLFGFYRMTVADVYFVGGFGVVAEWVEPEMYASGEPDPLAFDAPKIVKEINEKRQDELKRLCEVYLGMDTVGRCTMMGLDRLGFDLRVRAGSADVREYRVAFRESVENTFDCESALVKAFQEAWERQNGDADSWQTEGSRPTVMYYALT